jgi:DNA repair exonuclease SbcCD ATPase subunit
MARIHSVQQSRKEHVCSKCRDTIAVGVPYRWVAIGGRRASQTIVRCMKMACGFRPSDMTNSKLKSIYAAQEAIDDTCSEERISIEGILQVVQDASQSAGEVMDEYSESIDNIEQYFPNSPQIDEMREKIDSLENWISELDRAVESIEDKQSELEEIENSIVQLEEEDEDKDFESEDEQDITDLQAQKDEILEGVVSLAREASDSLSI